MTATQQRKAAMDAVPHKAPPLKREEKEGKLYVTIHFQRPVWQRFLGADDICDRTFGLDPYGRQVYESCDGKQSVRQIIARFAKRTHVSQTDAELAVTQFMRTLLTKGLIVMEMEKPS